MNPVLPDDAVEFGATARKAFLAFGGVDAARAAEEDPSRRSGEVASTLTALGIDELDPRDDADTLAAAAALCEEAGRVVLAYPVVAVLLRDRAGDNLPFAVVPPDRARVDHGDLFDTWRVAAIDGTAKSANRVHSGAESAPDGTQFGRLGPFVADLELAGGVGEAGDASGDVLRSLTLTSWQILGAADRAVELAVDHVNNRIQFGKPIATFQAVQFQLADAAVAVAGLREL
ncbi:MAG: acyl-CoA dehydrogenase, partial [Actinobacteria bacterium]|nr:acyl-CoA dehydrogenase [Actinomycetota bacterium]